MRSIQETAPEMLTLLKQVRELMLNTDVPAGNQELKRELDQLSLGVTFALQAFDQRSLGCFSGQIDLIDAVFWGKPEEKEEFFNSIDF